MKSRYILASALSLAVVGASVVSPFTYAIYQKTMTEAIQQLNRGYWGGHLTPSQNFGYWSCVRIANYNADNTAIISYTDVIICSNTREKFNLSYALNYDDSSTTTSYKEFERFQYVTINPNLETEYVKLYFDSTLVGVYGFNALEQSGTHSLILESSRFNDSAFYSGYQLPTKLHPLGVSGYNGGAASLQELGDLVDNPPPPPTEPTEPPYTTPAPNFPNLPYNWVNGDGNTYNIDLPDFNFDLELPTYTMPEAVSIPAEFVQKSSALYQIPLNIIDRFGLWWLVGLALICTVITLIINR